MPDSDHGLSILVEAEARSSLLCANWRAHGKCSELYSQMTFRVSVDKADRVYRAQTVREENRTSVTVRESDVVLNTHR